MDVRRLLEGVLGSGGARNLEREARRMMGGGSGGSGGRGGHSGHAAPRPTGGGGQGGFTSGMMGGALSGGLINMVMGSKKGRKMGGKALKYGGAALLAGLAYKAWSDWKGNQSPQQAAPAGAGPWSGQGAGMDLAPPPASSGFTPDSDQDSSGADFRLALIRAMIAAAKCDGHIDRDEHARIQQQISEQDLSAEEKGFLLDAFSEEPDPMSIARLARTPEQGAELYAASRLAIDPDVPAEHQYLQRLGSALGLPRELVGHLDAKVEAARLEFGREEA